MTKPLGALIALFALTTLSFAADNTLGTWKFDASKSKAAAGTSPIKTLTVVREASGGTITTKGTGERQDGSKIDFSYTGKKDGSEISVSGSGLPYDTIKIKKSTDNSITSENSSKATKYKSTATFQVSKDGKTATLTTKGTGPDGKPFSAVSVYQKQ